ncbi:MAG: lytic murein transglycosylase B, partial [Rubrivivax sp.]
FTVAELLKAGAALPESANVHPGPLAVVQLHNGGDAPTLVLGTQNFWTVTRYNWSAYYALAVIELGEAVKAQRLQTP